MKTTGDEFEGWAVAQSRDPYGRFANIVFVQSEEEAYEILDSQRAQAVLQFHMRVASSYDGEIFTTEREDDVQEDSST